MQWEYMTKQSSDSTRYIIQVGRNRFRRGVWESLKDICAIENTRMADEIWQALDAHVKDYAVEDKRLEGKAMDEGPQPDFSLPENNNVFDKIVDDMVVEASADEVEEVLEDESTEGTERGRVASSDMFGHYRKQE